MKTILILLASALSAFGQTPNDPSKFAVYPFCLVSYAPDNSPFTGMTNYPTNFCCVSYTNVVVPFQTNLASATVSNQYYSQLSLINSGVASANSNLVWFFNNFPAGITDTGNRLVTSSNDLASWTTGTNSAAQTNQIILRMLQDRKVSWIYENNIIQVLSTLSTLLTNQFQANGSH